MISLRWKLSIAEGHIKTLPSWEVMSWVEKMDALNDWIAELKILQAETSEKMYEHR